MAKLKTTVNRAKCIPSGECVEMAPAVFQLGEDGQSEVIDQTGAPEAVILAAARGCPANAIAVVNRDTGEQLFPPAKK